MGLEFLETRAVPAAYTWNGPSVGSYDDVAKWEVNSQQALELPDGDDDVTIPGGFTLTSTSPFTPNSVKSLTLGTGANPATLDWQTNSLTVNGSATVNGTLRMAAGGTRLSILGDLALNGDLILGSSANGSGTSLYFTSTTPKSITTTTGGTVTFAYTATNAQLFTSTGTTASPLTIGAGITVHGGPITARGYFNNQGTLKADVSGKMFYFQGPYTRVTNTGTLIAENGGTLSVLNSLGWSTLGSGSYIARSGGNLRLQGPGNSTNVTNVAADVQIDGATSRITASNGTSNALATLTSIQPGGKLTLVDNNLSITGALTNAGQVKVEGSGTLTVGGNYTQSGGLTTVNGTLALGSNTATVDGGILGGTGTVQGNLTQNAGGTMEVHLGGTTPVTGYDQLTVTGTATLAGTQNVSLTNAFVPSVGDTFNVLKYATRQGNFTTTNGLATDADHTLIPTWTDSGPNPGLTYTLIANLELDSQTLANATADASYSSAFQASGGSGNYSFALTGGTLPSGLSLNPATGVISGTPTAAGSSSFTVMVTDTTYQLTATQTYALTVNLNLAAQTLPNAMASATYSGPALSTTGGSGNYTFALASGSTLPSGMSLNAATGAISGTPTTAGTTPFTVTVTDTSTGSTGSQTYTLTVNLNLATQTLPNAMAGVNYSGPALQVTGGSGTYAFALAAGSTLPSGLSLNAATGAISGITAATGTTSFTVTVTDTSNGATGAQTYSLTVSANPIGQVLMVTSNQDGGSGFTLRQAIAQANQDAAAGQSDLIVFASALGNTTITLTGTQLELSGQNSTTPATITIDGQNRITISGGNASRIFRVDAGVTASLSGLTISDGSADLGAGIHNSGTLTVSGSTLANNVATNKGGGIYSVNATLTVSASTFTGGSAIQGGGILVSGGTATVTGSTFANNYAVDAGGAICSTANMLSLSDSTLTTNTSGRVGGAIANSSNMVMINTTLSANSALYGGGIRTYGRMTVTGSTIVGNSAVSRPTLPSIGGGIENEGWLTLTNTTVANNSAVSGGGIANARSLTLSNCTIANNSVSGTGALGGGIFNYSSSETLTLLNTIVAKNTAPSSASGPDVSGTVSAGSGHSLIGIGDGMSGLSHGVDGNQVGTAVQPIDPLLSALGSYGGPTQTFALLAGSPALSGGSALTSLTYAITSTATQVYVGSNAALSSRGGSFLIRIDNEVMRVTEISGSTILDVERGVNGTTPAVHAAGATVALATDQRGVDRPSVPDIGAYQTQFTLGALVGGPWLANQSGSSTIQVTGGTSGYANLTVTGLPQGVSATLSGNTITFSGTPTQAGEYDVMVWLSLGDTLWAIGGGSYRLSVV